MVMGDLSQEADLVVIGAGPGGYVAALRAADLGRDVVLIDARDRPGGVCLLEGCIPSKALINAVEVAHSAREGRRFGVDVGEVRIDVDRLREWTAGVVDGLAKGVQGLLAKRGVEVIRGRARFDGPRSIAIEGAEVSGIDFKQAILATGSRPVRLFPDLPLWTSTEAIGLPEIPRTLAVIGGGSIGLELGMVYAGLGSRVTLIEKAPGLLPGIDRDLVRVLQTSAEDRFERILTNTGVAGIVPSGAGYRLALEGEDGAPSVLEVDRVLVAVGRRRNSDDVGLDRAGIEVEAGGAVKVGPDRRTTNPAVFAIGDLTAGPMLAHKASREAKVAAEAACGQPSAFDNRAVPGVVYADPEIAVTGLSETAANEQGIPVKVGRFPMTALGRARTMGRVEGFAKVVSEPETGRVLGFAIVSANASELIAEGTLALEMGATLEDILVTIHPHPTMSEASMEAAEVASGQATHVNPPRPARV